MLKWRWPLTPLKMTPKTMKMAAVVKPTRSRDVLFLPLILKNEDDSYCKMRMNLIDCMACIGSCSSFRPKTALGSWQEEASNGLVTHKTQDIPRKVPDDTSSLHHLGLPETFLGNKIVSHKTFLRTAWDLPGMIIGRSCEGNSMCDGYNTFLGSCHSVLRRPWETARKKPVMYNC